jgi:hypothetical protein
VEEDLLEALAALRSALAAPVLTAPLPERDEHLQARDRLLAEVDGHVARVRDLGAPLLAVLGGGTGAGKSTVANSLVGQPVSATGVIRPTTSSPTLLLAPGDLPWFEGDRILPTYARQHHSGRETVGGQTGRVVHLVTSHAIPPGLAVLDAPDVDSIRDENRALADELLDAADVWVWFVTARTYADEAGMAYLRRAARRRTALAVVLNQVHDREVGEILDDLRTKLAAEHLAEVEVLVVPHTATQAGRLPDRAISDLRRWLRGLAEPDARDRLRRQTLDGALDDLAAGTQPLLQAIREERAVVGQLEDEADVIWARAPQRFADALDEGPPLRQEVVARWTSFVGASRFTQLVESATASVRGWLRDAMATATSAEQERLQRQVRAEVADTVADVAVRVADLAAADTAAEWEASPLGRHLLDADPGLRRASPALGRRAEEAMVAWQAEVTDLIATKGVERKARARWVSTLINAAATAAILATFASTGGITGAEAGIAAGATAANQALLVRLLGERNLQWVLERAREGLLDRVTALTRDEHARYRAALAAVAPPDASAEAAITSALRDVERARR